MLRFWTAPALACALALLTACTGGPQPDPPGGGPRDAGLSGADSGPAAVDAAARDGGGGSDSGPPADVDAGSITDGAVPMMDGAPADGATDAGPDAGGRDAGMPATCEDYCTCMFDEAMCLGGDGRTMCIMDCASTFTAEQLRCRAYHCTLADGPTSTHCEHAMGIGMCE